MWRVENGRVSRKQPTSERAPVCGADWGNQEHRERAVTCPVRDLSWCLFFRFPRGWCFVEDSWLLSSSESLGRAYPEEWAYPEWCRREHLAATLNVTRVAIIFLTLGHICCPVGWCFFLPVHDVFSVLGTLSNLLVFGKPEVIGLGPDSLQNWNGSIGLGHWKMPGCDKITCPQNGSVHSPRAVFILIHKIISHSNWSFY